MRPFIKENLRITLVESLILSKLNYMDAVYGPRLLSKTRRLIQRVQNACARFCFNIPHRAHVSPFLNKHGILKMMHRQKLHLACLLFGTLKHLKPDYLLEKLSWPSRSSYLQRECRVQLMTQPHNTTAFKGSFRYSSTKCWNNIPPPIRNMQTVHGFRSRLKVFLLEHQISEENLRLESNAI